MKTRLLRPQRERTIALINVVFLMLVFFLIAGTVEAPIDDELSLIKTRDLDVTSPPDGLVIHADGQLEATGAEIDIQGYLALQTPEDLVTIRVIPDRDLPALELLRISANLRETGVQEIVIATENALE